MKLGRIIVIWVFLGLLTLAGCRSDKATTLGEFDPKNEDQLIEVYVRSNYFKDFAVFDKFNLKGKKALRYTDAIVYQSADTVRWQRFLRKAEKYREKIRSQYDEEPASS